MFKSYQNITFNTRLQRVAKETADRTLVLWSSLQIKTLNGPSLHSSGISNRLTQTNWSPNYPNILPKKKRFYRLVLAGSP